MISVGIFFGYRSLYYYSKQNRKIQAEAQTLNGSVIQSTVVVGGDEVGLHHDSLGYYYKGNVNNNYVLFANRIFRIIRIYEDNTVKLVSDDIVAIFPWGDTSDYLSSNAYQWLDKTDVANSGVYYNTIVNAQNYLEKMEYQMDLMSGEKMIPSDESITGYVTLLNPSDYVLAGGKSSFLNNGKLFFMLGLTEDKDVIYADTDGSIQSCDSIDGYGIRPVITLKANTIVSSGNGTSQDPYVIYHGNDRNYVSSYVKLGGDIWRVFYQDEKNLKLSYNGYAKMGGSDMIIPYYDKSNIYRSVEYASMFDITDSNSIATYLNNTYLSSLSYKDILIDFSSYLGEISDDRGYRFSNIFEKNVNTKVGLLNVFDYLVNTSLEDFFRGNTTSVVGSMEYNSTVDGRLIETDVSEAKHVVPVVSISIDKITGGNGSITDPYIVG